MSAAVSRRTYCTSTNKAVRRVTHKEEFDGAKKGLKISKNVPTKSQRMPIDWLAEPRIQGTIREPDEQEFPQDSIIKVLPDAGNNQPTRDGPEPEGNGIDHKSELDCKDIGN